MNIWKEIKEFLLKYGEIIINKTEILTQMAKYKIAIKNREEEINKIRIEIGDYTIIQIEQKETINEEIVKHKVETINRIRSEIEDLNIQYNDAKSQLINQNKPETGSGSSNEKQGD